MPVTRNTLLVIIALLIAVSAGVTAAYLREREANKGVEITIGPNGVRIDR